jgi:hypothetical protein
MSQETVGNSNIVSRSSSSGVESRVPLVRSIFTERNDAALSLGVATAVNHLVPTVPQIAYEEVVRLVGGAKDYIANLSLPVKALGGLVAGTALTVFIADAASGGNDRIVPAPTEVPSVPSGEIVFTCRKMINERVDSAPGEPENWFVRGLREYEIVYVRGPRNEPTLVYHKKQLERMGAEPTAIKVVDQNVRIREEGKPMAGCEEPSGTY